MTKESFGWIVLFNAKTRNQMHVDVGIRDGDRSFHPTPETATPNTYNPLLLKLTEVPLLL